MVSLLDIASVFCFFLMIWGLYHIARQREHALTHALKYCSEQNIQLLDENVAIKRIWFKRDKNGYWRFWLLMGFEFSSTGEERYKAKIIMLGGRVVNIILPPYRMPNTE